MGVEASQREEADKQVHASETGRGKEEQRLSWLWL